MKTLRLFIVLSFFSAQCFAGGSMIFDAASGAVNLAYTAHSNGARSYAFWALRTSAGEGSLGRMFDKRDSGGVEVELLYFSLNTYRYERVWSGGTAAWTVPSPSINVWHHIVVIYNAAVGVQPIIYIDGISAAVTTVANSAGTITDNANNYWIGNRGSDDRTWGGNIADFRIYNRLLTANDVKELYACGDSPVPDLIQHLPMWDYRTQYSIGSGQAKGSVTGATTFSQDAPPITLCNAAGGGR